MSERYKNHEKYIKTPQKFSNYTNDLRILKQKWTKFYSFFAIVRKKNYPRKYPNDIKIRKVHQNTSKKSQTAPMTIEYQNKKMIKI